MPDDCDPICDSDGDGIPDDCDIDQTSGEDCDGNGEDDSCQSDCDADGTPDDCQDLTDCTKMASLMCAKDLQIAMLQASLMSVIEGNDSISTAFQMNAIRIVTKMAFQMLATKDVTRTEMVSPMSVMSIKLPVQTAMSTVLMILVSLIRTPMGKLILVTPTTIMTASPTSAILTSPVGSIAIPTGRTTSVNPIAMATD